MNNIEIELFILNWQMQCDDRTESKRRYYVCIVCMVRREDYARDRNVDVKYGQQKINQVMWCGVACNVKYRDTMEHRDHHQQSPVQSMSGSQRVYSEEMSQ